MKIDSVADWICRPPCRAQDGNRNQNCSMKKTRKINGSKIKLKGLVMPTDWDEKGNVSAINISAQNEEEYSVLLDDKGNELLAISRKPVIAVGSLRLEKNRKIIKVEEYSVINGKYHI